MNAQNLIGRALGTTTMPTFDDFDACAEALKGWNLEAVPLQRQRFTGELRGHQSSDSQLFEGRFGIKLHQLGAPPDGLRTVVIPGDAHQHISWRRHEITGSRLMLFPSGSELDAASSGNFHVFAFSFSEEKASEIGEVLSRADYPSLVADREMAECRPQTIEKLRSLALRCVSAPTDDPESGEQAANQLLEEVLIALCSRDPIEMMPPSHIRSFAVRRALEFLAVHERRPVSVTDLCRETGVSRRTLEYAFKEHFGVAPKEYMMSRRLAGFRRDLIQGGRSVTEVAGHWGFTHMSQLAALYRRAFQELPSQTLKGRNANQR